MTNALIELGYDADDRRDYDAALALAEQAVAAAPNAAAYALRARVHHQRGDFDAAQSDIARALQIDRDSPDALRMQAQRLAEDGEYERAIAMLDAVLLRRPDHYGCLLARGWTLHEMGDRDGALRDWRTANRARPERFWPYQNIGTALLARGDTDDAVALLLQAAARCGDNGMFAYNIGTALYEAKAYPHAIELLDRARALLGEQNAVQHNRALCLVQLGRDADAIEEWSALIEREPEWAWPRNGRARALVRCGRTDAAEADWRHCAERGQHHWDYATYLYDGKRYAEAIAELDGLDADGTADAYEVNLRGRCRILLGEHAAALPDIERALALMPDHPAAARNHAAILNALGRHRDALKSADAAVALDPVDVDALTERWRALIGLGRGADAVRDVERDPPAQNAGRFALAELLREHGDPAAALPLYALVCQHDTANGYAAWAFAECLRARGQRDAARDWYGRAEIAYRAQDNARSAELCREAARDAGKRGLLARLFGRS